MLGLEARDDVWRAVRGFMRRSCGVALADDQAYLLEGRLAGLVSEHGFSSIAELVGASCTPGAEAALGMSVIDALTTHETFFFRDLPFWRTLEDVVVPRLLRSGRRGFRFWSMACAHGQEPYSLAMLLEERWPALAASATIFATDVSAPAIARAREGRYSVLEVNRGLGAARLLRHFERSAHGGFAVKPTIRARVSWATGNLLELRAPEAPFDVVLCRNVLIYFDDATRAAVLKRIPSITHRDGFLGLGVSEVGPGVPVGPGWFRNV
jgi:chemotaxis protein methyltransferase CheR